MQFTQYPAWYTLRVLIFIAPLLHPQNASSWDHVLDLLDRTLKSVCNQTDGDFRVIIVHNKNSPLRSSHPKVIYHPVDLPPNLFYAQGSRTEDGRNAVRLDKGLKYLAGLYRAREFSNIQSPAHIMLFDADDCVSSHLAEFVNRSSPSNGWVLNHGFLHQEGRRFIYYMPANFSKICGTCHVIRHDLFDLPPQIEAVSHEYAMTALGSHIFIGDMLAEKGTPLQPLPFIGAVYMIGHGDNHGVIPNYRALIDGYDGGSKGLRGALRTLSHVRLLTKPLRQEFGLYPINLPA